MKLEIFYKIFLFLIKIPTDRFTHHFDKLCNNKTINKSFSLNIILSFVKP